MILPARRFHTLGWALLVTAVVASFSPLSLSLWWLAAQTALTLLVADGLVLLAGVDPVGRRYREHSPLRLWLRPRRRGEP